VIDDAPTYGKDSTYETNPLTETLKSITGLPPLPGLRDMRTVPISPSTGAAWILMRSNGDGQCVGAQIRPA
jgi:hypothetical protein